MNKRNEFEHKFKDLQKEYDKMAPPTLDGRRAAIEDIKEGSKNYYEHVDISACEY